MVIEVIKLRLDNDSVPFDAWKNALPDKKMRATVESRIASIRAGNFGDCRPVGDGAWELKIDLGPGLRIYYGKQSNECVLLLGGGFKKTQQADIQNAIKLWKQWKVLQKL